MIIVNDVKVIDKNKNIDYIEEKIKRSIKQEDENEKKWQKLLLSNAYSISSKKNCGSPNCKVYQTEIWLYLLFYDLIGIERDTIMLMIWK